MNHAKTPRNGPLFAARIPTIAADYFQSSNVASIRSASATGSADAFYHREWEDHWQLDAETRARRGTYEYATYDDHNYP